jgi:hypothetical protein
MRASLLLGLLVAVPVFAQSTGEKVKDATNDGVRAVKKGTNRVKETLCTGTKAQCAGKKMKNRVNETKDDMHDKAVEVKDKVDADGK